MAATMTVDETMARSAVITEKVASQQALLIIRLIRALLRLWSRVDPYDGWSVTTGVARSVSTVAGAQRQARLLARQQAVWILREIDRSISVGTSIGKTYPRGNANIFDVWERPAEQFRYAASENPGRQYTTAEIRAEIKQALKDFQSTETITTEDPAVRALVEKVVDTARQEVQLATRDEERRVYSSVPAVTYTRRIIHPELSKTGTCGLCIAAASRVYKVHELKALHDGCKCTTLPVVGKPGGDGDPGFFLNRADLDSLYDAAGSMWSGDLSKIRVFEFNHGELGPYMIPDDRSHFDPLKTQWKDVDDSTDMWQTVDEIARSRLAGDGVPEETASALRSMQATAKSNLN